MNKKGIVLIALGILGAMFVSTFDIIMGKPVNDISGPRSIAALIICAVLVIMGIRFILKSVKKISK